MSVESTRVSRARPEECTVLNDFGSVPISLLLVEDERLVALDLQRRLERFGYRVLGIAADAAEALRIIESESPDVLLLDVHLQGTIDGIQLADQLRNVTRNPPAFIFVSGNADEATLRRAQATSPFNYIVKPVRDRELRISVEAAVHHQRLSNQIRATNESLERRVQERTADLARMNRMLQSQIAEHVKLETQLRHSRTLIEVASKSRARFFGQLSHEIRTPMNGIVGMADVLSETALNEEQRDFVETIKSCSNMLLETIDSLVLFAELEGGRVTPRQVPFQFRQLISEVYDAVSLKFASRGKELTCDLAPELPVGLVGDPYLLRQALTKLAEYVLSISDGEGVCVQVERLAEAGGKAYIHFALTNHGPDLPENVRSSIQRTLAFTNPAERQFEEVPFDLSVASLIIQLLEGLVWLDPIPGVGNAFNVALWLQTDPAHPC